MASKNLFQIIESIIISSAGGEMVDESALTQEVLEPKVDEARAVIIAAKYAKTRTVHPNWQQEYFPVFDAELQEDIECTRYRCPPVVFFDKRMDGLMHIGARDCPENFVRVWNRNDLATRMKHPVMRRRILTLLEGEFVSFYAKRRILDPKIIVVASSPSDIPTYNKFKDAYPLDPDSVEMLEKFVRESFVRFAISTPRDEVSDSDAPKQYTNPLLNRK